MFTIPDTEWEKYQNIINDFIEQDSGLQSFLWLKASSIPTLPFGEDNQPLYVKHTLKGLFQYNYIRSWPYNKETISGTTLNTNLALFITKRSLEEQGFLNEYGYWKLDSVSDRFIINGKVYKPSGDMQVAQAKDTPLLFFMIMDIVDATETQELLKTYNT